MSEQYEITSKGRKCACGETACFNWVNKLGRLADDNEEAPAYLRCVYCGRVYFTGTRELVGVRAMDGKLISFQGTPGKVLEHPEIQAFRIAQENRRSALVTQGAKIAIIVGLLLILALFASICCYAEVPVVHCGSLDSARAAAFAYKAEHPLCTPPQQCGGTGSMYPLIERANPRWSVRRQMRTTVAWLVVLWDPKGVKLGDICQYAGQAGRESGVSSLFHRVVGGGPEAWVMQGDANAVPDITRMNKGRYQGTVQAIFEP